MRKIIDGKVYNTETAECLGFWSNHLSITDFRYCKESLYRTRKGRYFIYGEGGAMSCYAEQCGDMWGDGADIRVVSEKEAREWAERHFDADEYENAFGEVEEA